MGEIRNSPACRGLGAVLNIASLTIGIVSDLASSTRNLARKGCDSGHAQISPLHCSIPTCAHAESIFGPLGRGRPPLCTAIHPNLPEPRRFSKGDGAPACCRLCASARSKPTASRRSGLVAVPPRCVLRASALKERPAQTQRHEDRREDLRREAPDFRSCLSLVPVTPGSDFGFVFSPAQRR